MAATCEAKLPRNTFDIPVRPWLFASLIVVATGMTGMDDPQLRSSAPPLFIIFLSLPFR